MTTGTSIQTLTIVAGTMACNATCPDCVSQMTTGDSARKILNFTGVDWENLRIAANIAIGGGATTVLFTGKGEPTLYPDQLNEYLKFFSCQEFYQLAVMEIQTNGLLFQEEEFTAEEGGWLKRWYENGLRVISISIVDVADEKNRQFLVSDKGSYPSLAKTLKILHGFGYTVRLNVTMMQPFINSVNGIERVVEFCLKNEVEQLSLRPVRRPAVPNSGSEKAKSVFAWVKENELTSHQEKEIAEFFVKSPNARLLRNLVHGARVYDYRGQNLCLTDCLTSVPEKGDEVRQLIFYSGGLIAYDWQSPAANIIGWGPEARKLIEK